LTFFLAIAKLVVMFRSGSWIQRASVGLLLLISLGAGTLTLPHARGADDGACSPIAIAHDESAHSIVPGQAAAPDESSHCFLCHSLRTFDQAFDKFQHPHYTPRTERMHLAATDHTCVVAWTLVPGRAPPV
jgi:hypothetical protein